jgi:hypothetical protein
MGRTFLGVKGSDRYRVIRTLPLEPEARTHTYRQRLKANHLCVDKIIVPSKQRVRIPMNTMNNSINIVMGTINHEYCIPPQISILPVQHVKSMCRHLILLTT